MENESINPELPALLADFRRFFVYPEVKEELWYCVLTALSKDGSLYDDAEQRTGLLFLYEKLEGLLDAIYRKSEEDNEDNKQIDNLN